MNTPPAPEVNGIQRPPTFSRRVPVTVSVQPQPSVLLNHWHEELSKLVKFEAWRLAGKAIHADFEDLCQAGWIGVLLASRHFDPARGVPFTHYARWRIRGEMLDQIRAGSRSVAAITLDDRITATIEDDNAPDFAYLDRAHDLNTAVASLDAGERELLHALYGRGLPLAAAAEELGYTLPEARKLHWQLLRSLRSRLADYVPPPCSAGPTK